MGLLDTLRRLFGRWGRPTTFIHCHVCRGGIPPKDFERGRAVMLARRPYCQLCVIDLTSRPSTGNTRLLDSSTHVVL